VAKANIGEEMAWTTNLKHEYEILANDFQDRLSRERSLVDKLDAQIVKHAEEEYTNRRQLAAFQESMRLVSQVALLGITMGFLDAFQESGTKIAEEAISAKLAEHFPAIVNAVVEALTKIQSVQAEK